MIKKHPHGSSGVTSDLRMGCCKVESVVSVDHRGQMVLPKEIRDRAEIRTGDKLAIIGWEKDDTVCCIFLMKVDRLADMVKGVLGPMLKEIAQQ